MAIRVTQGMIHTQLLSNLYANTNRLSENQNIAATGKKLNKPADDPVGITYALRYRSDLSMNTQYQKNVDAAASYLEHTDTVLGQFDEIIQRAKELTVQGVSGSNPQTALDAIAQELGQIYEQAVTLANSQFNGKYIFNGQLTDQRPYTSDTAASDLTDTQQTQFQLGAGISIPINLTGNEVLGKPTDGDNLFAVLKGLKDAFEGGLQTTASDLMEQLDGRYDKILNSRAELGARSNRVELIQGRLTDLTENLTALDSKVEDADMAETIMKLQQDQNVYQASLSVGAKIIQSSLLDYLK
ncbi:flagellar hook-associated protein FlgL [Paenibacillus sp. y28]|uniref:flagellar hook-associated protein FlgL n=1 Tax=Paenibacillus sp. y28 TaxID=3129110 RepID=UPI00301651AD